MTDYFDLAGYLKSHIGLFPSQYAAAVTILVVSIPVGIIWTMIHRRNQYRWGKDPINWIVLPVATFMIAAVGFFLFDNNVREQNLYTYNYYKSTTNSEIMKWANGKYGLHIDEEAAASLKFKVAPSILGYGEVTHPLAKLPNGKTVQLASKVSGTKLHIYYVDGKGRSRELTPLK